MVCDVAFYELTLNLIERKSPMSRTTTFAVYAMAFGNFAAGMSVLVIAGVLTELANDINVSAGQAGQLISVYSFSYALGAPILMSITTRYQRRIMLTLAISMIFIGNGVGAIASDYTVLFIVRIVTALGAAGFVPLAAASAISMVPPEQRGRVSAVVFTGFTLASALGLPIGTYIGLNFGWRWSLGVVSIMAVIATILMFRFLPHDIETPAVNLAVFRKVFANTLLIVVLSVTVLQFAGQMAMFAYISPWLKAFTTLDAGGITLILLVNGVGGVFGNYAGGWMADRFGARRTQLVQLIFLGLSLGLLPLISTSLLLGGALIFIWGFVGQGFIAPQLVRLVGVDPTLSSASLSLNSSFINIGLTLGGVAGGFFLEQVGVDSLSWLGVIGTVLSLFVFALSWTMETSQEKAKIAPA